MADYANHNHSNHSRPAPLRTSDDNTFAYHSMKVRVPRIIRDTNALNPDYDMQIQDALEALAVNIETDAPITMIDDPAPDYETWEALHTEHAGQTWLNAEWFYAEIFMYRHMMQAIRWWETGRDPFTPRKNEELATPALWERLDLALGTRPDSALDRLSAAIRDALWGNRADLSYAVAAAHGSIGASDDLLIDHSATTAQHMLSAPGTVHLVADNTGTELATDFALIDTLLSIAADRVYLHLKMHPTYVSDATVPDALTLLSLMESGTHSADVNKLGARLREEFTTGRFRLAPDLFWNSSRFLWELPPRLMHTFRGAALVIFKGDANYRRVVGDALWPPETPLASVVDYFPAPLLALRTLKSDPVVGLPAGLAARLDGVDPDWRINGKRGVIELAM